MSEHKHLRRLDQIWTENAIFFVTTNTHLRRPLLANSIAAEILVDEWKTALSRHGWMVGRYVIMPDHVHFFCAPASAVDNKAFFNTSESFQKGKDLSGFMRQWKQWTSKRILLTAEQIWFSANVDESEPGLKIQSPIWQEGFFDHLLRSGESYRQKWEYVRLNPLRKGLIEQPDDWPWQGEIYPI